MTADTDRSRNSNSMLWFHHKHKRNASEENTLTITNTSTQCYKRKCLQHDSVATRDKAGQESTQFCSTSVMHRRQPHRIISISEKMCIYRNETLLAYFKRFGLQTFLIPISYENR